MCRRARRGPLRLLRLLLLLLQLLLLQVCPLPPPSSPHGTFRAVHADGVHETLTDAVSTQFCAADLADDDAAVKHGRWRPDADVMARLGGQSSLSTGVARVGVLAGTLRRSPGSDNGEQQWQFNSDEVQRQHEAAGARAQQGSRVDTLAVVRIHVD